MNNLPPFYAGQKIVSLRSSVLNPVMQKGNIYTCASCFQRPCCNSWAVEIKEMPKPGNCITHATCPNCNVNYYHGQINYYCGSAKHFAPVQENFQSITLEKVLEEETKLIGVN